MKTVMLNGVRRNPYPAYALLRRFAPTFKVPGRDIWMLFDYASVKRALNDPASFSSAAAPPSGSPLDWLIFLDPPRHTKLRAIISRTFTPRALIALEPRIREFARELMAPGIAKGEMDLVGEFSTPLPLLVIAELLGIEVPDRGRFLRWSDAILHLGDTIGGGEKGALATVNYRAAREEMRQYLEAALAARATAPTPGLLTQLAAAEVDGERLTFEDILGFFQLLLLAGTETTTNLISNTVICLDAHRDQLAMLHRDASLIPQALEEVLRYRSPVQMVFRATTSEIVINGKRIPAGKLVLPMIGSANRDASQFREPNRFDITRSPNQHAGFGHGIHFCLGAALARVESRVAIEELLPHLAKARICRNWEAASGVNVHGPASLRVSFSR